MTGPTFLLIGGQKCGTTTVARHLLSHPDVYVPGEKELHFYDVTAQYRRGLGWYTEHFAGRSEPVLGECTPNYLGTYSVPEHAHLVAERHGFSFESAPPGSIDMPKAIRRDFPDLKLVVILRDPVERAISSYYHQITMRRVSPFTPFREVAGRFGITSMGFYAHHLGAWFEHFDPSRFLVVFHEDLARRPTETLAAVCAHIGADPADHVDATARHGQRLAPAVLVGRYYAPRLTRHLVRRFPRLERLPAPAGRVTDDDRRALQALYHADLGRLADLVGRPVPPWVN